MKRKANLCASAHLCGVRSDPHRAKSSALWSLRPFVSHPYAPGLNHVPALASS
jgi:hypothetical protein